MGQLLFQPDHQPEDIRNRKRASDEFGTNNHHSMGILSILDAG